MATRGPRSSARAARHGATSASQRCAISRRRSSTTLPAPLQQICEDRLTARTLLTTGAAHEAEVNRRLPSMISVVESCSPTISTGGESTVRPFSIGGSSGTASAIQALAASMHLSEMLRRVFSNPTRGLSKSCYSSTWPSTGLHRIPPPRTCNRSHMHTARFYRFLLFQFPCTGKAVSTRGPSRKRKLRRCASTETSWSLCEPGRPNNQPARDRSLKSWSGGLQFDEE